MLQQLARSCPFESQKIRQLIQQYEESRSFFEKPLLPRFVNVLDTEAKASEGLKLGAYRLTRPLGQGGMGSVWLAVRDDGTHQRQVAVKMLTRIHCRDFRLRFQKEQQILAVLDHPNIARLYDSGITDEGIPFYVMQYVQGERLDHWANQHQLDLKARLRLFQKVCLAVNFAHQNLVVHRDLKPQNILVTESGEPMLLDFGIAKVLESDEKMTDTGLRPMTREYASPEQILGQPISITSDIYSLGVILYELLTGSRPHTRSTGSAHDLERRILEDEPSLPSDMLGNGKKRDETDLVARGFPVHRIYRKTLKGELDAIVLMALNKKPSVRYNSALQLAEEIDSFLGNRPIRAQKANALLVTYKFLLRNYRPVILVLLMFSALVGFLGFAYFQQKQMILLQRKSKKERSNAEEAAEVMTDMLAFADPSEEEASKLSLSDLTDQADQYLYGLDALPGSRAILACAIGNLYRDVGDQENAIRFLGESINTLELELNSYSLELVPILELLAEIHASRSETDLKNRAFSRAAQIRACHSEARETAKNHFNIGLSLLLEDRAQARDYLEQSEQVLRNNHIRDEVLGNTLLFLGHLARQDKSYQLAIDYYFEAALILNELKAPKSNASGPCRHTIAIERRQKIATY